MDSVKTSTLIPFQLPEHIREDDGNFVAFLQAYYEWLEQNNNVLELSKNILNYTDIDRTSEQFLQYYINDFLKSFPENALINKNTAIKAARQLYKSKGTPASYQFLFRILFNSDFDAFYTKDYVLRASSGEWYVAKSLKLSSGDPRFLEAKNLKVFGETSKSLATIENVIIAGNKVEVFISDIERLFSSGEFVRVVDSLNKDIIIDGSILRAKVLGQINQIRINPGARGLLYQTGDPVIVYGGLNDENGIGAVAEVGETTKGSIQKISVISGGFGYRQDSNTVINILNAPLASAVVASVDDDPRYTAQVTFVTNNVISLSQYVEIGNTNYSFLSAHPTSNANTKLSEAFTFNSFTTYPISSVFVENSGSGITKTPVVSATSNYTDELNNSVDLKNLGILAPIQIVSGGTGYAVNDSIQLVGGSGYGAYANVTNVSANGVITEVSYVFGEETFPLGGMGYRLTSLPALEITSSNGSNAVLSATGILGDGASFSAVVDRVGSIKTINLLSYGEDYVSTPNVSLKVEDIVVSNASISLLPEKGDIVYQGVDINVATYLSTVNSISILQSFSNPQETLYNLRVFNYTSVPDTNQPLKIYNKNINLIMANSAFNSDYNDKGIRIYGDGLAKATASFLNGLVISEGIYLSDRGHLSGFNILQDSVYNNYTYLITVDKEISKYRETLLNLIHPAGMKLLGRYAIKSSSNFDLDLGSEVFTGKPLDYYTGYAGTYVTITTDFNNLGNNIVQFNGLVGANISGFITTENELELKPGNGPSIKSLVSDVDYVSNTVTLTDFSQLTYANVALIEGYANSNTINIISLTGSYDIINNGEYSDPSKPLKDIVYPGDRILVANNTAKTVYGIDYNENIIYLTENLSQNAYSNLSVNRTYSTSNVIIWGAIGFTYVPELITEDGNILITEDGREIQIG